MASFLVIVSVTVRVISRIKLRMKDIEEKLHIHVFSKKQNLKKQITKAFACSSSSYILKQGFQCIFGVGSSTVQPTLIIGRSSSLTGRLDDRIKQCNEIIT